MAEKKKDEVDRYLIVTEPIADLRKEPLNRRRETISTMTSRRHNFSSMRCSCTGARMMSGIK